MAVKLKYSEAEKVRKIARDLYGINIRSKGRKGPASEVRFVVSTIYRDQFDYTTVSIGEYLGRDHSTICHHVDSVHGWLENDDKIIEMYDKIFSTYLLKESKMATTPLEQVDISLLKNKITDAIQESIQCSVHDFDTALLTLRRQNTLIHNMLEDVLAIVPSETDIYNGLGSDEEFPTDWYKGALRFRREVLVLLKEKYALED